MIDILNANQGVIAVAELIISFIIAIIGFYINKNIFTMSQNQNVGNNSKAFQSTGRDAIDNSTTTVKK